MRLLIRGQRLPTKATSTKNKKGKNKTYLKFQQNTLKNWFHILRNTPLVICMNFDIYWWFSPISIYFLVFFSVSLFLIMSRVFRFLDVIVCFPPKFKSVLVRLSVKKLLGTHTCTNNCLTDDPFRFISFRWVFPACIFLGTRHWKLQKNYTERILETCFL